MKFIPACIVAMSLVGAAAAQQAPTLGAIITGLETRGYRVTEVEVERLVIEVEAVAPDGRNVKTLIDPATGNVIREEVDR